MKRFLFLPLFLTLPLAAQNFSPSASGIGLQGTASSGITSPSTNALGNFTTPNSIFNAAGPTTAAPSNLEQLPLPLGNGTEVLNQTNTAPTPIPEDTSLIRTPTEQSILQAQEAQEETTSPIRNDTEVVPGINTGGSTSGASTGGPGSIP